MGVNICSIAAHNVYFKIASFHQNLKKIQPTCFQTTNQHRFETVAQHETPPPTSTASTQYRTKVDSSILGNSTC